MQLFLFLISALEMNIYNCVRALCNKTETIFFSYKNCFGQMGLIFHIFATAYFFLCSFGFSHFFPAKIKTSTKTNKQFWFVAIDHSGKRCDEFLMKKENPSSIKSIIISSFLKESLKFVWTSSLTLSKKYDNFGQSYCFLSV